MDRQQFSGGKLFSFHKIVEQNQGQWVHNWVMYIISFLVIGNHASSVLCRPLYVGNIGDAKSLDTTSKMKEFI